jgi:hypothetical protein
MIEVNDLDGLECTIYESDDENTVIATNGEAFAVYERVVDLTDVTEQKATEIREYRGLAYSDAIEHRDMFMFGYGYELRYKTYNR